MIIRDMTILSILSMIGLINKIKGQEVFNFGLQCNQSSYQNWANFECKECGQNQIAKKVIKGCVCSPTSIFVQRTLPYYNCNACPANQISYPNSTSCITADTTECPAGNFHNFFEQAGVINDPVPCVACSPEAEARNINEQYGDRCEPCGGGLQRAADSGVCTCGLNNAGGLCLTDDQFNLMRNKFASFDTEARSSVVFESLVGTSAPSRTITLSSSLFSCKIQRFSALCYLFQDQEACSGLANLCVMSLYNAQNAACRFYNIILEEKSVQPSNIDPLWKLDLPWLYYGSLSEQVIQSTTLIQTMAFTGNNTASGTSSKLPLYLVQYNIEGSIKSFTKLSGDFLFCPHSTYENELSVTFGVSYKTTCSLNLTSYFEAGKETYTYELLIKDGDRFVDIPVAISNLKDSSRAQPNRDKVGPTGLTLTRRFLLVDKKTGITGAQDCSVIPQMSPEVITYLSSAMLIVEGQRGVSDRIFRPYMLLSYGQKRKEDLSIGTNSDFNYASVYILDMSTFWVVMIIFFVMLTLLGACIFVSRIYVWRKYYPSGLPNIIPDRSAKLFGVSVFVFFHTFSVIWFIFLTFVTTYWYAAYKWQDAVFTLLPSPSFYSQVYLPFYWLFWITFGFTFLSTFILLYRQSVIDILLIDWEKERFYARRVEGFKRVKSVWRSLLIGNEYNELTTERYINFFFVVFTAAMFLLGFNWEQYAANTPYATKFNPNVEINFPLKYFLNTFLIFFIGFVSYVVRRLLVRFIPSDVENFVDLCSVANISVFFFDSPFHGYYIHGKNPSEKSDGQLYDLTKAIFNNAKGNSKKRGLDPNDSTELQCFEFFMTVELREQYNYVLNEAQELATGKKNKKRAAKNLKKSQAIKKLSKASQQKSIMDNEITTLEQLEKKKSQLSTIFRKVIETAMNASARIPEKTSSMNFFGMPPSEQIETLENPQFFRDPLDSFKNTGMLGSDVFLLIYDCMILNAADLIFQSTSISLLALIIFEGLAIWFRNNYGEDNISKKTLIDERFLI